ncbi:MAG: permease prefix domain 1-containing protein [Chloroflexota bacterium]
MDDLIGRATRSVPASGRRREAIARELRSHVGEAKRELEQAGWDPAAAEQEGLARLGDPTDIAREFHRVYQPSRRNQIGLAFALAGALVLGMFGLSGPLASATSAHHAPAHHTHQQASH